jgi:hypothetical protein
VPFLVHKPGQDHQAGLSLQLELANAVNKQSDLAESQINKVDLGLWLDLMPVEVVFQMHALESLTQFFKVRNMKDRSKIVMRE